jgi:acyl-CoA synthetase (AMP-forming)/AMP-acid ligase II
VVVQAVERDQMRSIVADEVVGDIREAIAEAHELQAHAVVLTNPGSIPRTSSGKVRRAACRELFLQGRLDIFGEDGGAPEAEPEARLDVRVGLSRPGEG